MASTVERMTQSDVSHIHRIGTALGTLYSRDGGENCFWPAATLSRLVDSKDDICLKLVNDDDTIGFALVMIQAATRKAVIENFYVMPGHENLAANFYSKVEDAIRAHGAEFIAHYFVKGKNSNSLDFFDKAGYMVADDVSWLHKNISFSNPVPKE